MNLINTSLCPICGQPNKCHMANGRDPSKCWCHSIVIPKQLLEMIPSEKRGQSCICRHCIVKYHEKLGNQSEVYEKNK